MPNRINRGSRSCVCILPLFFYKVIAYLVDLLDVDTDFRARKNLPNPISKFIVDTTYELLPSLIQSPSNSFGIALVLIAEGNIHGNHYG